MISMETVVIRAVQNDDYDFLSTATPMITKKICKLKI